MQPLESQLSFAMYLKNYRWRCLNVILYICLVILVCVFNKRCLLTKKVDFNSSNTDSNKNLDLISLRLDNNGEIIVMVNETTHDLYLIKFILSTGKIIYYNLFDAYEFSKAFKQCINGNNCGTMHKTRRSISQCGYYFHVHLVQFCYNSIGQLTSVILHNEIILSKNDVFRFNHILNLFIKV